MEWFLNQWGLLYLASEWAIRLVMLVHVPRRRTSAAARTWLLLIFFMPLAGLILYWIFGRIRLPERRIAQQQHASQQIRKFNDRLGQPGWTPPLPEHLQDAATVARRLGDFPVAAHNSVEILGDYEDAAQRLLDDIASAQNHIHILTYIFGNDHVGRRFEQALATAVQRGVVCRVLADSVGSGPAFKSILPRLRQAGVEVIEVLPVGLFRSKAARFDLRNHRKIAIIDGHTGHIGSQNLVSPDFIIHHPNEELVVRVRGPVVAQLQAVFLTDRFIETEEETDLSPLFPALSSEGTLACQVLPSGPAYPYQNPLDFLVTLIHDARHRVTLVTPYFVPDEIFLHTLRSACLRGVQVDVIVPMFSNLKVSLWAQESHYEELLDAGVNIHRYRRGFLHAKHVTVDGAISVVGSTNIDIRSFALNAEASLLVYDADFARQMDANNGVLLAQSELLTRASWKQRPLWKQTRDGIARLADSLL